jgi:hypothetical protein
MVLDASQIPSAVMEHFSAGWQKEEQGAIIGFFMVGGKVPCRRVPKAQARLKFGFRSGGVASTTR